MEGVEICGERYPATGKQSGKSRSIVIYIQNCGDREWASNKVFIVVINTMSLLYKLPFLLFCELFHWCKGRASTSVQEVVGSIPGWVMPKTLKIVELPTLLMNINTF